MFILLISLIVDPAQVDSLTKELAPKFIKKRVELLQENSEYRRFFGPYSITGSRDKKTLNLLKSPRAKTVDTLRVAVIRVQFMPDTTPLTTGDGRMNLEGSGSICDTVINGSDTNYVRSLYYDPPHNYTYFNRLMEFLHNYFWEVSYHRKWIEWTVLPDSGDTAYNLPHKMTYYGDPSNYVLGLLKLLRDGVEVADYDADFSGIDEVIIFHAGSMYQSDLLYDSPYDLPAVSIHGINEVFGSYLIVDGDTVNSGIVYPETGFQDGQPAYLQGGLCHEFAHSDNIGLLDLYDTSGKTMGVGGWALMGTGNWNQLGLVPPRICGPNKIRCCFDTIVTINRDTNSVPIKWSGSMDTLIPRMYRIPINKHEYFLIENRHVWINPDTTHYVNPCTTEVDSNGARVWKNNVLVKVDDYDSSLPPSLYSGGLAVWHIDEKKIAEAESLNMINAGSINGIDMEEADGIQDFEKDFYKVFNVDAAFFGSKLDVFREGGYLSEFTQNTQPSTDDNYSNWTGVKITGISPPDTLMYFDVKFERNITGFPKKVADRMDVISPQITGSTVYTGDMYGGIYSINPDDTVFRMMEKSDSFQVDSTYTTPLISDITGDGYKEIFSMTAGGRCFLYSIQADSILDSLTVSGAIYGNASAGDINGIPGKEILFGSAGSELHVLTWEEDSLVNVEGFPMYVGDWLVSTPILMDGYIYALPADGRLWKISPEGSIIWRKGDENLSYTLSSPVAGDLDQDGTKEIFCPAGSRTVYLIDTAGRIEWEKEIPAKTYFSTPALGDLDGDGYLDIVFADSSNVFALNRNGILLDNFPVKINLSEQIQSSIILSDINGDSLPDIIFGSPDGGVYAYSNNGEKIAEFPYTTGERAYSTPLVTDMDSDGFSELLIGSRDGWLYGWKTEGFYRKDGWNQIYFNNDHRSIYPDSLLREGKQEEDRVELEEFYVYPSPVQGMNTNIRFKLSRSTDEVTIKIFSLSGREVESRVVEGYFGFNDIQMNLSREGNGLYLATIEINGNIEGKKKFAISRN